MELHCNGSERKLEPRRVKRHRGGKKKDRKACKKAKLQAGIKLTALCSAIDKENSIESPLDLLHYIYNYYCGYTPGCKGDWAQDSRRILS